MSADHSDAADDRDPSYTERVGAAYEALRHREGIRILRDSEIARRMVAVDPGLRTTYMQAGRLLEGQRPRKRRIMIAFAKVLGVDPGWLDYGEASAAPAPPFFTAAPRRELVPRVRPVPVAEAREQRRQVAKKERKRGRG